MHLAKSGCRSVAAAGDSLFFCFAKSKVSKRKGDPTVCVPALRCGQPAVLDPAGVELELASLKQSLALFRLNLRSSAHSQGFGRFVTFDKSGAVRRPLDEALHDLTLFVRRRCTGARVSPRA